MPGTRRGYKKRVSSFQIYEDESLEPIDEVASTPVEVPAEAPARNRGLKNVLRELAKVYESVRAEDCVTLEQADLGFGTHDASIAVNERVALLRKDVTRVKTAATKARTALCRYEQSVYDGKLPMDEARLCELGKQRLDKQEMVDACQGELDRAIGYRNELLHAPASPIEHRTFVKGDLLIRDAIIDLFGFEPRPVQLKILSWLVFERKDCIITGKTSMGKSLPIQALPLLLPGTVAIVVLPLDKIGDEQAEKCIAIGERSRVTARPLHLNADTKSKDPKVFARIRAMEFTHIFLGPEQAVGPDFATVLADPSFKRSICLVAIDEAHLVGKWGETFRQSYSQLAILRSRLGRAGMAPWYACTATLDAKGSAALIQGAGFDEATHRIRASIDRPEIAIIFKALPSKPMQPFEALGFLVERCSQNGEWTPLGVPQTIVFVESKAKTRLIMLQLRKWMKQLCPIVTNQQLRDVVRTYHRNTAARDKDDTYLLAKALHSTLRIIVATESLGLGIDLPYIDQVVLYGLPIQRDLDTIMQRIGRCCRSCREDAIDTVQGKGVVLFELVWDRQSVDTSGPDAVDVDVADVAMPSIEGMDVDNVAVDTADQSVKVVPAVLQDLFDANRKGECLRRIIHAYYEESRADHSTMLTPAPQERCCSGCNPSLVPSAAPPFVAERKVTLRGLKRKVAESLELYAHDKAKQRCPDVCFDVPVEVYLGHDAIDRVAHKAGALQSAKDISSSIPGIGPHVDLDGLLDEVHTAVDNGKRIIAEEKKQQRLRTSQALWRRRRHNEARYSLTPMIEDSQVVGGPLPIDMESNVSSRRSETPVNQQRDVIIRRPTSVVAVDGLMSPLSTQLPASSQLSPKRCVNANVSFERHSQARPISRAALRERSNNIQ